MCVTWRRLFKLRRRRAHASAVFGWQCLAHLPHDPALAPSVDPSISQIPPINPSGSFYDGIILSISSLSRSFIHVSTDLVYVHMDLSTQVSSGSLHARTIGV